MPVEISPISQVRSSLGERIYHSKRHARSSHGTCLRNLFLCVTSELLQALTAAAVGKCRGANSVTLESLLHGLGA